MANTVNIRALDGSKIAYVDKIIGRGTMKDVYFAPDKSYVVAFYRKKLDPTSLDRIRKIVDQYRQDFFNREGGDYWKNLFCFPYKIVEHNNRTGIVVPTYPQNFFFEKGSQKGKEKQGKWFTSPLTRKLIDATEIGDFRGYLSVCIQISRAVKRMHQAGLAHSDLSYKNVLVDPKNGRAIIIDIDGLVVEGKYDPDVLGTPDFIAPEIYKTMKVSLGDKNKNIPTPETDLHALAVLIYMYLLHRHPLDGKKIYHENPAEDNRISMGEKALFVEHPSDSSNRPNIKGKSPVYLPWVDVNKLPYTVLGPYLTDLIKRAFIDGLHQPGKRPVANDWERALVKTVDLLQPCGGCNCGRKWFVFNNSKSPKCPINGWQFKGQLPILNLYSRDRKGKFVPDNHRLMVYSNQYIYPWHVNRRIVPNERLKKEHAKPVGYFVWHQNKWVLVNQGISNLMLIKGEEKKTIAKGKMVELKDGTQLLFSAQEGGRLAYVQMITV